MENTTTQRPVFFTKVAPIVLTSCCFALTVILSLIFYFAPIRIEGEIMNPFIFGITTTVDFVGDIIYALENGYAYYYIEQMAIAVIATVSFVKMTVALISSIVAFSSSFAKDQEKCQKARANSFSSFKDAMLVMIFFYLACLSLTTTKVEFVQTSFLIFALFIYVAYDLYNYYMSNKRLKIQCYITRGIYHATIITLTILFGIYLLKTPVISAVIRNAFELGDWFSYSDAHNIFGFIAFYIVLPIFTVVIFSNYNSFIGLLFNSKIDIKKNKEVANKFTTLMVLSIVLLALTFMFCIIYFTLMEYKPDNMVEIIFNEVKPTALPLLLIAVTFKFTHKIPTPTIEYANATDDIQGEESDEVAQELSADETQEESLELAATQEISVAPETKEQPTPEPQAEVPTQPQAEAAKEEATDAQEAKEEEEIKDDFVINAD